MTALATAVAAIATAYAAFSAASAAKHSAAIADRDAERWERERLAQQRCRVGAQYLRADKRSALVIWNGGPAVARDLEVAVDPDPQRLELDALRPNLAPGLRVELTYRPVPGEGADRRTIVRWTDATGERHQLDVPPQWVHAASPLTSDQMLADLAWRLA